MWLWRTNAQATSDEARPDPGRLSGEMGSGEELSDDSARIHGPPQRHRQGDWSRTQRATVGDASAIGGVSAQIVPPFPSVRPIYVFLASSNSARIAPKFDAPDEYRRWCNHAAACEPRVSIDPRFYPSQFSAWRLVSLVLIGIGHDLRHWVTPFPKVCVDRRLHCEQRYRDF
jgi:hypothetical protein